jgi:hypothetical protein
MLPINENKLLVLTIHPKKLESRNENRNQQLMNSHESMLKLISQY